MHPHLTSLLLTAGISKNYETKTRRLCGVLDFTILHQDRNVHVVQWHKINDIDTGEYLSLCIIKIFKCASRPLTARKKNHSEKAK